MKQRVFAFDFIRAIAIILVVCIHSQGVLRLAVEEETSTLGLAHWCTGFWHFIFVAVPLFVMLSGALLLGKQEPLSVFFKRRFTRVLIPFVVWSVIIGILVYYKENHTFSGGVSWILISFFTSGVYNIYWYVYLIIGLYLLTPLLRYIIVYGGKVASYYMVALIFGLWLTNHLFPTVNIANRFASENLIWIGYYVAGHLICNTNVNFEFKQHNKLWLILGLLTVYIIGFSDSMIWGHESKLKPIVRILEALMLFALLSKCDYKRLRHSILWDVGVKFVSEISYGMYLTHFVFISILVSIPWIRHSSLIVEPFIVAIGALLLDLILMGILKK